MKLNYTLLSILTVITYCADAQNVPFDTKSIPDRAVLGEAIDSIKSGNKYYKKEFYKKALIPYLFAHSKNPNNADINFKIGHCYLQSPVKSKARPYLEKASQLATKVYPDILYNLARAYQFEHDWNNAIKYYDQYKGSTYKKEVPRKIEQCNYALSIVNVPANVEIENMGDAINSKYAEYVPVISTDGENLFFTARRPNTVGKKKDPKLDDWLEDIYHSRKNERGHWIKAKNLGIPINSDSHDATVNISADGQFLYIYRSEEKNGGDIYVSNNMTGSWSEPIPLNENINTKHQETAVSVAADGKTIYFVSNKPGGHGNLDIYMAELDEFKQWGKPKNLGEVINTEFDEDGVFIHPDGKTLYFSSEGHKTIGGLDIFKSEFIDGTWTEPVNLGMPINTADHDASFVMSADGNTGYYASGKMGGMGEKDIYKITFHDEPRNLMVFKGIVEDEFGNKIDADIRVTNNTTGEIVYDSRVNSKGSFLLVMNNGSDYTMEVGFDYQTLYSEKFSLTHNTGYLEDSHVIILPTDGSAPKIVDYVYTVQIASTRSQQKAEKFKQLIEDLGIEDVNIQTVKFSDTKEQLYRVRIAQFDTFFEADAFGKKLPLDKMPDKSYWVDNVREDNLLTRKAEYEILEEAE